MSGGESLQVHLDGTHEHVCLSCTVSVKQREPASLRLQLQGFSATITASNEIEPEMIHTAHVDANAGKCVSNKSFAKFGRHIHTSTRSTSLQIPKAGVHPADSAALTFEDESPGPPSLPRRRTALCHGCPGALTVARPSLHAQTLTAAMGWAQRSRTQAG